MGTAIGIDVGGSTTKIIGVEDKRIKNPMFVKAIDPVTSLFGAFGKYIHDSNISLSNIERVILTSAGSAYIDQPLYGLPTAKTDEFLANGLGAQYNMGLDSLLVVSMGTGTSFVKVQGSTVEHIRGLGIGGGAILGLFKLLLKTHDFHQIVSLAEHGSLNDINLHIRDITPHPLPGLPPDVTASIFGKADANVKVEDIALGIVHMVLQTIGQGAVFASLSGDIKNIVLIGNLTRLPQCPDIFPRLEEMCDVHFRIPGYVEYRTIIGAALCYIRNREYRDIFCEKCQATSKLHISSLHALFPSGNRRMGIERKSGENPGQSRCCKLHKRVEQYCCHCSLKWMGRRLRPEVSQKIYKACIFSMASRKDRKRTQEPYPVFTTLYPRFFY